MGNGTVGAVLRSAKLMRRQKRGGGGEILNLTVTIAIGDAAFNALKFTLTLKDADKCSYICTKASEAVPAAATIIAEGQSVSASGVVEIAGLEPNTAYRLSAVALKGNINGKVSSIEHTTSAPGVHPAVVLDTGPVHHNDSYVQRRPDRPRNRSLCLPRKDRGADPSHGRGDTA